MSLEKSKKKGIVRVLFLCRFCKWCVCLVGIDFCRSGERSVAIHSPPINHSPGTRTFFSFLSFFLFFSFFFFFFWRQTLVTPFWLFIIQTSNFFSCVRYWWLFLLNVALYLRSSGQDDWPGAIARDWRLRQRWKSLKSGLFPVLTLDEHITKRWQCISRKLKLKKKKQSLKAILEPRKCLRKVQKALLLAWSNGRDAPNLVPGP